MENCQYIKAPYIPATDIPTIGNISKIGSKEVNGKYYVTVEVQPKLNHIDVDIKLDELETSQKG